MPIIDSHALKMVSRSAEQTRRIGMRIGHLLQKGDLLCLTGDLGAGKTTFVQGVARGWGSLDQVTSPTFVLVNRYRRPDGEVINHLDAYRLSGALDAEDLDFTQLLEEGPLLVEWPERIKEILPRQALWVALEWVGDEQRNMLLTAQGARFEGILPELRRQILGGD
ncbi:MAG TPA: tRNA (adenosine(37)-N6)-threonylcarbamoyltransferase complex ATPase subunit type 1 TsaE [Anaerolineaceae bacterium]|nr:tRNA (adenosine(37)-N6)-threonylcarbamoyltransferase complex ATPase subunit type 1 TsaE [Anaerolineaceae bacterium]HPN52460.1 tRNA (adenosine(37)-N6)-threonylcarbamoyltransferase complex ATPase subunit type 1 TsaE [Anaerolineaceae bacterium]